MATIESVLFYLDDNGNFPISMLWSDVLGSTGIMASDGSIMIPQVQSSDGLTIRIVNFAPPSSNAGAKFGSILAIAYVWSDGSKSWVKQIGHAGPSATNVSVAVANQWVDGQTISAVRNDPRYVKPYIGNASASDYVDYIMDAYEASVPTDPSHSQPMSVDIIEHDLTIQRGNSVLLHAVVTTPKTIKSQVWTIPSAVDIQSKTNSEAVLVFNTIGQFTIRYDASNVDNQAGFDTCVITVVDAPKKKIDVGLWVETNTGTVAVEPTITLNDYPVNTDNLILHFRNTGDSNWTAENFKVEVGSSFYKFMDGSTEHTDSLLRQPETDYTFGSIIQDFDKSTRYTIVLKATVIDDQGQILTKFFEIRWFATAKTEYPLEIVGHWDETYKSPSVMKRNARYRGQRESEKVLSSHQEQIYDIRQNYVDIQSLTDLQDSLTSSWFQGESEAPVENITYSTEKTFDAHLDQASYPLIPGSPQGAFSNVMVELNGNPLVPSAYTITNGFVVLQSSALQNGPLKVAYTATVSMTEQRMNGLDEMKQRMQVMNERVGELERRYTRYENAYK
jgi:hypothetical protein